MMYPASWPSPALDSTLEPHDCGWNIICMFAYFESEHWRSFQLGVVTLEGLVLQAVCQLFVLLAAFMQQVAPKSIAPKASSVSSEVEFFAFCLFHKQNIERLLMILFVFCASYRSPSFRSCFPKALNTFKIYQHRWKLASLLSSLWDFTNFLVQLLPLWAARIFQSLAVLTSGSLKPWRKSYHDAQLNWAFSISISFEVTFHWWSNSSISFTWIKLQIWFFSSVSLLVAIIKILEN